MARKEKMSNERKNLIKQFISENELKTAGDARRSIKKFI